MAKKIEVTIKGLPPGILQHRFPLVTIEGMDKKSKEEQAEIAAYRDADTKELYIPGDAVQQALVAAATYSKGKGRGSLQKVVAASVFVNEAVLGLGTDKYVIDSRSVVNPPTGGRLIRHRPHIKDWTAQFSVTYDELLLSAEQLRKIVDNAGSLCGLLDYRPNCKGPFGRFMVTAWDEANDDGDVEDLKRPRNAGGS